MSETPEEKEAFDKVDELVDEAAWREERKASWWRWGAFGPRWPFWTRPDQRPGGPGLRDALHGSDDET